MSIWVTVAKLAVGVNIVLLLALAYVWGRNYAKFRSKHTLGLLVFSAFLLLENAGVMYYYIIDPDLSIWWNSAAPAIIWKWQMGLHVVESVGLAFLTWATWD
jgi:hypothetical protein